MRSNLIAFIQVNICIKCIERKGENIMKKISPKIVVCVLFIILFSGCVAYQPYVSSVMPRTQSQKGRDSKIHEMGWGLSPIDVNDFLFSLGYPINSELVKDKNFPKLQLTRYRNNKVNKAFYLFWKDRFAKFYNIHFIKRNGVYYFDRMLVDFTEVFGVPSLAEQSETLTYTWKSKRLTIQMIKYKYKNRFVFVAYDRLWKTFLRKYKHVAKTVIKKNNIY